MIMCNGKIVTHQGLHRKVKMFLGSLTGAITTLITGSTKKPAQQAHLSPVEIIRQSPSNITDSRLTTAYRKLAIVRRAILAISYSHNTVQQAVIERKVGEIKTQLRSVGFTEADISALPGLDSLRPQAPNQLATLDPMEFALREYRANAVGLIEHLVPHNFWNLNT